jgi:hypothetical protein
MSKDKSKLESKLEEPEESSAVESFGIPYAGEITVPSSKVPPSAPPDKKIHRRRPLPPVADSAERENSHGEKDRCEE